MSAILKTWPAFMDYRKVRKIFSHDWARFYFSLGRGRPKDMTVDRIWFAYRGRLLGYFPIEQILQYNGTNIPPLRSLSGETSGWQFKFDVWVAVCVPPMQWLKEKLYHDSFRGWRYFDFESYRDTMEAKTAS